MRGITDAQKACLEPASQPVDLYSEQLDIVPGLDLGRSIGRQAEKARDRVAKSAKTGGFYCLNPVFRYHERAFHEDLSRPDPALDCLAARSGNADGNPTRPGR